MSSVPWGNETERADWYQHEYAEVYEELERYRKLEEAGRLIEVVRCKDCIRHENSSIEEGYGWCDEHERITGDDDYCSYAISKFEVKAKLAELKGANNE